MTVLISVVGAICVAAVVVDVLWTTVAAGAGGGPFTTRLTFFLWRMGLGMRTSHQHRILQVLGVVITLIVIFTWIVLLLAGWFLIFNVPAAVVDATTACRRMGGHACTSPATRCSLWASATTSPVRPSGRLRRWSPQRPD